MLPRVASGANQDRMRALRGLWLFAVPLLAGPAAATAVDPVSVNIRAICKSQKRCMVQQRAAMRHALNYLATERPPGWRLQVCNRNASRGSLRVDWVGFDNCLRNPALKPPLGPRKARKRLRLF